MQRQNRFSRFCCIAFLVGALIAGLAGTANAHPHIWIKNRATIDMDKGRIVAVTQEWTFDAFFSAALIKDFDADKDGKLSPAEITAAKKNAFDALKSFNYFTQVRLDGKKIPLTDVRSFTARIDAGRVVYRFTLGLPAPIDPRRQKAAFLFYDATYYVDVALDGANAAAVRKSEGCRVKISDDTANPIYFGLVVPKMVGVICGDS